ncbi:MAG: hypothetical protein KDK34_12190 [Leptospiraceae bacterium]|nr:hypothetical protein [Leptospiraceae bacterium]
MFARHYGSSSQPVTRLLIVISIFWIGACSSADYRQTPLSDLPGRDLTLRIEGDVRAVQLYRKGLMDILLYIDTHPNLFPQRKQTGTTVLREEQRHAARAVYRSFLDYMLALESIDHYHRDFYRLPGSAREDSLLITYSAFLARYRFAMAFIERMENEPAFDTMLNEQYPELGIPSDSYAALKYRFLHIGRATGFVAFNTLYKAHPGERRPVLRQAIENDRDYVWDAGKWDGPMMTMQNAVAIVQSSGQSAWMPVQAGVAEWMGDTKVLRLGRALINEQQIHTLSAQMQPGDFMLQRREWYLSNIGLPGFWSHAALYIGTAQKRAAYFDDPAVKQWVRSRGITSGDFNEMLQRHFPEAYRRSLEPESDHIPQVLEAMSEGVVFTSMEHSAAADSVAALRPDVSVLEKAPAIYRAFSFAGRPYDFNFDFRTDAELVCTELIYKAYEPRVGYGGIQIPLVEMLGRYTLPANEYARLFDSEYDGTDQQLELIAFLDGIESRGSAIQGGLAEFRESWKRPKWHILTQNAMRRSIADDYVYQSNRADDLLLPDLYAY